MGVIFPLSWPGKIVLMLIAVMLGLIWSMLMWPGAWRKLLGNEGFLRKMEQKVDEKKQQRPPSAQ
jgi:hypothetical protein